MRVHGQLFGCLVKILLNQVPIGRLKGLVQRHGTDCGEIDIMEHWGTNVNHVSSALHTPSSFGATTKLPWRISAHGYKFFSYLHDGME